MESFLLTDNLRKATRALARCLEQAGRMETARKLVRSMDRETQTDR
jgi:pentatricopeptide repeat protein